MKESVRDIWTITDLVQYMSRVIDQDDGLARVWVQGEISNFRHHARGHMYFTLKDEHSRIRAVMFAGNNRRLKFTPRDGDDVLVRGRVAVYEREGQVQLYVTQMQPNGVGELYVAFQRLKERLEEEGLFSPLWKKPLPFLPRRVGVITSADGAAVRDIITTIRRRMPIVQILLHPVPVQGEDAAPEIADALDRLNERGDVDVIIVGRGGGSLEELWAFNEEMVARSIHRSRIPVVSAVGHETDTTISDFAADIRAATPTAAAELVAPRLEDLQGRLSALKYRLQRCLEQRLHAAGERLRRVMERPVFTRPGVRLEQYEQRLDVLYNALFHGLRNRIHPQRSRLERVRYRLQSHHPAVRIQGWKSRLERLERDCRRGMAHRIKERRADWLRHLDRLDALSPLKVMKRGYSLVYREDDQTLVKSIRQIQPGDPVRVHLSDGKLHCQVWGMEGDSDD